MESILLIDCEIPLLKLAIEFSPNTISKEDNLIYLKRIVEYYRDVATINEAHKKCVKAQQTKFVYP